MKDYGVIDLTVGDEMVLQSPFAPAPPDRAVSPQLPVNNMPECIASQLETWYCNMNAVIPPPCAVGAQLARRIKPFRPGLPVFFSYKGVEEMSVMAYELDRFEGNINRFIIVAEGPTKGPFIIQCRQFQNRKSLPLSYHIWEGVNGPLEGFELEPSIVQLRRSKENDHRDAQNITEGSTQLAKNVRNRGRILAETAPLKSPTPELSGFVTRPPLSSQPQMTYSWTESALVAENSYEMSHAAILSHSASRSPPRSSSQKNMLLKQAWTSDLSAAPIGPPNKPQNVNTAIPMTPHAEITQDLAAKFPHSTSSMPQCRTARFQSSAPNGTMPPTMSSFPAIGDSLCTAKGPIQALSPSDPQIRQIVDYPTAPCAMSQSHVNQGTHSDQVITIDELEICQNVLTELMDVKNLYLNQPFLEPVDPVALDIPNYFRIIQQPMDLSTIAKKLAARQYRSAEDFKKDLGLMFNNCSTFNEESDSVHQNGLQLNELFVELWAQRKCPTQDDSFLREVNVQPISGHTESTLPRHARPTIDPFTPPTTSAASLTQGHDIEQYQLLVPATGGTQWPQAYKTPAPEQPFPQKDSRQAVTSPELCQDVIAPCETPRPRNRSSPRNSHPLRASSDGKDVHQATDHCSQGRPEWLVQSDSDWETLQSSRENSYDSEMLEVTEREFYESEMGDHGAFVAAEDNTQTNSEPSCKRRRSGMSRSMDGFPEDTSLKRTCTVHRSQTPYEPRIQDNPEGTSPGLSKDGAFTTNFNCRGVPWKKVYNYHGEVFESISSADDSRMSDYNMKGLCTDQIIRKTPTKTDNTHHVCFPQTQQKTNCPVEPNKIQATRDPYSVRSEEPSESEYVERARPSDTPAKQDLSSPDCSYANSTSDPPLQPDDSPHQEHEEANPESPHIITEKEGPDIDGSAGEFSDQEYSARDDSDGDAFEPDQEDSGSEASDLTKQKKPTKKLPAFTALKNMRYPKYMRPLARAKLSEVVNGKRKCGLCQKFKSSKYMNFLSAKTDCYICKSCKVKERLEEDCVDMKERCVDCKIRRRERDLRSTNADCDYICNECQRGRDGRDGQPPPKRARVTHPADRRCDDCGGDRKKGNWRRNPDREGGYICQTCATYLRRTKVHRQLNETKTMSVEKACEETLTTLHAGSNMATIYCIQQSPQTVRSPDQENNLDLSTTPLEPVKKEIIDDDDDDDNDDVVEIPPPTLIGSTRLRQHMRDNVVFLFYMPSGQRSDAKTLRHCDNVRDLFGQALAAKVYGLADEKKQPAGNVLEICYGAGQAGAVGSDLRLVQGDEERFGKLVEAIERRGWWGERSGAGNGGGMMVVGSGILEVRAVG